MNLTPLWKKTTIYNLHANDLSWMLFAFYFMLIQCRADDNLQSLITKKFFKSPWPYGAEESISALALFTCPSSDFQIQPCHCSMPSTSLVCVTLPGLM